VTTGRLKYCVQVKCHGDPWVLTSCCHPSVHSGGIATETRRQLNTLRNTLLSRSFQHWPIALMLLYNHPVLFREWVQLQETTPVTEESNGAFLSHSGYFKAPAFCLSKGGLFGLSACLSDWLTLLSHIITISVRIISCVHLFIHLTTLCHLQMLNRKSCDCEVWAANEVAASVHGSFKMSSHPHG
jgi:hypothetical protein